MWLCHECGRFDVHPSKVRSPIPFKQQLVVDRLPRDVSKDPFPQ